MKYIYGNVFFQWVKLIANVVVIFNIGMLIQDTVSKTYERSLAKTLILCGVAILIRFAASIFANRLSFRSIAHVKMYLRDKLYAKLLNLGSYYHEKVSTAELVQIAVDGIEQIEIYVGRYLPQFYYSMLAPITLFVLISTFSLKSAAILLACVPLIPLSIVAFQKIAKRIMKRYWNTYTELGDTFLENLQGLTTLKIYETDGYKHEQMNKSSEKFRVITMKLLTMQLNSIIIMNLIAFGGAAIAIIVAASEYTRGSIELWQAFSIIMLGAEFFIPLRVLGSYFHVAMNGTTACEKLFNILELEEEDTDSIKTYQRKKATDSIIELDDVSFAYGEDNPVLKNVTLKIKKGELVSLVGKSGCGKSTIAGLVMGHVRGYSGGLYIDGIDAKEMPEKERMKKITLVSNDSYIFKGTVRENLLMGDVTATDEQLLEALEKVKLKDYIISEGGLDFQLQEQGNNLSGGQRQRLAIARAFLHNSDIYIFDEATSNIDVESENYIMDFIHEMAGNKTIILISHRLANVVSSDSIYVIENGKVIESGKHDDLMRYGNVYCKLYKQQYNLERYGRGGLEIAYA